MPQSSSTLFASQNAFAALDTKKSKKKKSSKEKDDKVKKDKPKISDTQAGTAAATVSGSTSQPFNSSAPLNWADDDDEDDDFGVPVAAWMQVLLLTSSHCTVSAVICPGIPRLASWPSARQFDGPYRTDALSMHTTFGCCVFKWVTGRLCLA